jgi:two-component system, OmpR family, sensor histidine kinase KdpD
LESKWHQKNFSPFLFGSLSPDLVYNCFMQLFYSYRHYLITLILFGAITIIAQVFKHHLEMTNIILIHLLPIIVIALRGNFFSTTVVTTVSIGILALFYIPPTFSFIVNEINYIWSFIIFYIVGYTITYQAKKINMGGIKETLLNTLSHDLKTPLSSILGNATFLVETYPLDLALRYKALLQIIESSRQMNRLISSLLDSARLQNSQTPLKNEWCDMEDLISIALREFRSDVLHERVECRFSEELPLFYGDNGLLIRLFVNLIDNALKYSYQEKLIEISITATASKWYITFSNQCAKISSTELSNLFEKFYRIDNTADISGSGIGLSICKEITRAHNGNIRAYNHEHGISVEVIFPILKCPVSLPMEDQ